MYCKQFLFSFAVGTILVLAASITLLLPTTVRAQCGNPQPSSCTTCHAKEDPVADKGEWHIIHASKDICMNCHGGNGTALDKNLAHEGIMAQPLADIFTDCHSCHPDYETRAAQFAPILGVTPGSCATPTAVAVSNTQGGPPSGNIVMPSDLVAGAALPPPISIIGGGVVMLAFFFLALHWLAVHHL